MKNRWILEVITLAVIIFVILDATIKLVSDERKCQAYGEAHNIKTSFSPSDGCVKILPSKRLY